MTSIARRTRELVGAAPEADLDALVAAGEPVIFKGLAHDLPLVRLGLEGPDRAIAHLKSFDAGRLVTAYTGPPEIGGRFGYDEEMTGMNFEAARVAFGEFLDQLIAGLEKAVGPSLYIGSTDLDTYLPGLRQELELELGRATFAAHPPLASIWIGNRTTAAAHYDMSNNLAICIAGRRRFTLFPPEQVENLYPGPLEPTPGGQVVAMADIAHPDFQRFPRLMQALEAAEVAELEPGDVLVYPALWWHQVEALGSFNILVNYWWNAAPDFMDTPQTTLLHALLSLRDRPEHEKRGWKALFDYYVFGPPARAGAHLPEQAQGPLGALDERKARRLRGQILQRLNR
jgi:hypothetical protein